MLLQTITMADLEQFPFKNKPVIYTRAFVELYKLRNHRQVNKINGMIESEKMQALNTKILHNLDTHQTIKN